MKVGDLVRHHKDAFSRLRNNAGIIIAKGVFVGNKDIKVLWHDGAIRTAKSEKMEVISEGR